MLLYGASAQCRHLMIYITALCSQLKPVLIYIPPMRIACMYILKSVLVADAPFGYAAMPLVVKRQGQDNQIKLSAASRDAVVNFHLTFLQLFNWNSIDFTQKGQFTGHGQYCFVRSE